MKTKTINLYQFDELSESAKEKARDWWRSCQDENDLQHVIDDFETIAEKIGINFSTHKVNLYGGGVRHESNIWYSGFCSQGDGACFEGSYRYKAGFVKAVKDYAPQDKELHRICDTLQDLQKRHFYQLRATINHSGRYYHSNSVSIDVYRQDEKDLPKSVQDDITELMRDLMDWLYRQLEKEYDYQNSNEYIDETIRINEYDFDSEGRRV